MDAAVAPARFICTVALVVVSALVGVSSAVAAQIFPSVDPPVLKGAGPYQVTYTLEFDTGAAPEQLVLSLRNDEGFPPIPTTAGPGVLTNVASQLLSSDFFCAAGGGELPPSENGSSWWLLTLPPATKTVVTLPATVGRRFAIGENSYGDVHFAVATAPDGFTATSDPSALTYSPIDVPQPGLAVPRDVPISLTVPAANKTVSAGKPVVIKGKTSPLLAGKRIALRAKRGLHFATKLPLLIARVKIGATGAFSYGKWRPKAPGRYVVGAAFDSHDPRFLDSTSQGCFSAVFISP
jgi:hypothetical protein